MVHELLHIYFSLGVKVTAEGYGRPSEAQSSRAAGQRGRRTGGPWRPERVSAPQHTCSTWRETQPVRTEQRDGTAWAPAADSLSDSNKEKQVREDDRQPLEKHRGRAGVVQVLHHQHVSVKVLSHLGQTELEPGKEGRVVQRPLRCVLRQIVVYVIHDFLKIHFSISIL